MDTRERLFAFDRLTAWHRLFAKSIEPGMDDIDIVRGCSARIARNISNDRLTVDQMKRFLGGLREKRLREKVGKFSPSSNRHSKIRSACMRIGTRTMPAFAEIAVRTRPATRE
jgi:hypothetical protein